MSKAAETMTTTAEMIPTDKLSSLPDPVLNRILCFLPQKEAVRTCVLSKPWRHRGPTRTTLRFCQLIDFRGDAGKLLSVLDAALQTYNRQNLCLNKLVLRMFDTDGGSFNFDLPSISLKAPFLQELFLGRCDLRRINSTDSTRLALTRLRKLSLSRVFLVEEALETLLSKCPSIEYLRLGDCNKLVNMKVGNAAAGNLKHFVCWQEEYYGYRHHSIEIDDSPTLETVCIDNCNDWYFHDKHYPRLKSIRLTNVRLSSESFSFFTPDYMPSLGELELDGCYGFNEFHLSSPSVKQLSIICLSELVEATIDAPNIICFKLKATVPAPSICITPISSDWKSHVHLPLCVNKENDALPWILELTKVLTALSQSQITLELLKPSSGNQIHIEDGGTGVYKPLVVEHLTLLGFYSSSSVPVVFNYLFRACRPRYIYDVHCVAISYLNGILWEVLLNERERSDYFWNRDLVEVSVKASCDNGIHWRPVHANSLSECGFPNHEKIRFGLKWRE